MAMQVETIPAAGFLRVVATGEFSLEEARRTFLAVVDAVAEHRSERVLFDGRRIAGEPSDIERFYFGDFAAETCFTHLHTAPQRIVPKFAFVLREPVLDPGRFGETVARNRGMIVKAFDDLAAAYGWLGLPPPGTPADPGT